MPKISSRAQRHKSSVLHPVSLIALIFCIAVALAGGASRADALSQVLVRLASIVTIAALLLWRPTLSHVDRVRPVLGFAVLGGLLIALQLVPLPPEVWMRLPGRAHDATLSTLIGTADGWRPVNLTPDLGLNAGMALLPVFATIALLAHVESGKRWFPVAAIAAIAIFSALLGLLQLTDGPDSPLRYYAITSKTSAVGVFANRNHNATLLALSLPILAYWGTRRSKTPRNTNGPMLLALAAMFFVLLMVLATGSRFGLVAGALGLTGSLVWWAKPIKQIASRSDRKIVALYISGALVAVVAILFFSFRSERAEAIRRLLAGNIAEDQRVTIGPVLLKMAETFFPVGSGFGSFEPVFRRFEPIGNLSDNYLNQAHNDFVQIVIEGGLPVLVLLALFFAWWMHAFWRAWRSEPVTENVELARLGTIISVIVLASSAVDYPLRTPLIAAVFTIAIWCMSLTGRAPGSKGSDVAHSITGARQASG